MPDTLHMLEVLARDTHKKEAELMTLAFETGVRQLWRENVLGRYLRKEISRDQAIEEAGIDWVYIAERQHKAMLEDLAWALEK